ncbi:MAG: GWxTD domain-containing protein, partial [Bacteroidia bacterium]
QQVQALFSHGVFLMGGKILYVETYLLVRGSSVKFHKNGNGKYQGKVEVTLTASLNESIKYADKYILLSQEADDSINVGFNFIDQQRISLLPGNYDLDLQVRDVNGSVQGVQATSELEIQIPADSVSLSSIQLVESYTKTIKPGPLSKGGYDLIPHISEFFGSDENKLIFYNESYNSLAKLGVGEKYLIKFHIEELNSSRTIAQFTGFEKANAAVVNVFMKEIDISELPNGAYRLVIEARDRENNLLATKSQEFIRANPGLAVNLDNIDLLALEGTFTQGYKNPDSLAEHIKALRPIASEREKQYATNVLKDADFQLMKQYFLSFWLNRAPSNPQESWERYRTEVVKVQSEFSSSIKRGYNTDRGRVYLQYGPPDNRTISPYEPSAYPYEIWQYYKINNQSNRRFVFYNPDLVTNDYALIHSDALGEIMNDQWQFLILKRDTQTNDIDQDRVKSHFGSQIQQNFDTPR